MNQNENVATATKQTKDLVIVAHYTVTETKNVIFLMVEKNYKGRGFKFIFPSVHSMGEKLTDLFNEISINKTGKLIIETIWKFKFEFEDEDNKYKVELHAVQEGSTEEWTLPGENLVHMSYYDIQKYNTTPLTKQCADLIFKVHLGLKPVVIKRKQKSSF